MSTRRRWFEREFAPGIDGEAFPELLERLRGTPARIEERLVGLSLDLLRTRWDQAWSLNEHVGHLDDLEELWLGRIVDFEERKDELRPADLRNRKTEEAGHNEVDLDSLLRQFRKTRTGFVAQLENLTSETKAHSARHPRLGQPMRVVDLMHFVAEHDDHHLALITHILRAHG